MADDLTERRRVLALLRLHGWNATSFQVLEPGFRYWFDGPHACVAYVDTGGAWVAAGAPFAPLEHLTEVATRFINAARKAGRRACFFGVESRFLKTNTWAAIQLGEQAVWDPNQWTETLRATRSLREQLRRAKAKGVSVRILEAAEVQNLEAPTRIGIGELIARWHAARPMAPMGFLVDVQPFGFPEERLYVVAQRDNRVVGFLAAVPVYARNGWLFEDFLRDPTAPNGTAELLIDAAMRAATNDGGRYVTMGLAPLAGDVGWGLRVARSIPTGLYDFRGIHSFKSKLRPDHWEEIYLAYPHGALGTVAIYDVLAAFARGSFTRFGLSTLLRGPALVVRVLAGMLIPWTILLAMVDARWFPATWVQWAWTGFDIALAMGMFVLAARWSRRLASVLTVAVSLDAAITLVEVLVYNVPRASGPFVWLAMVIACAAPALAAVVLWGALSRRAGFLE